ncbi:SWIM-type domain-containing protein [Mycena kentingensis (nom. inval.)]|nr:SWIM-type domain-containing protein [Mycena kentingensis (nom. inval.)]
MSSPPTSPVRTKKCTSQRCTVRLPLEDNFKRCIKCRDLDRTRKQVKRAADKAAKAAPASIDGPLPAKKARTGPDADTAATPADSDAPWNASESETDGAAYRDYLNGDALFKDLSACSRAQAELHFKGRFKMPVDPSKTRKERVKLTNEDVRLATGFRFTVHDNKQLASGHKTIYWCSQDANRKKTSKPSKNPNAKPRETPGMKRYPCRSRLVISVHSNGDADATEILISINLRHHRHDAYEDHSIPPGVYAMVAAAEKDVTPALLVDRVKAQFKTAVSRAQVYNLWRERFEAAWKRDDQQLASAQKLLKEFSDVVDLFEPVGVPDDVVILAWGMRKIAGPLEGQVNEIAMDATRTQHELRNSLNCMRSWPSHDNAGFPLAYCLLSTTSSISLAKRKKSLTAFATCVRDKYNIQPEFIHVDKDIGEINALRTVFPDAKISICWWHINDAVGKRIKSTKMSTTKYNPKRARQQDEYEGGKPDDAVPADEEDAPQPTQNPSAVKFTLPAMPAPRPIPLDATGIQVLRLPALASISPDVRADSDSESESGDEDEGSDYDAAAATGTKRKRGRGAAAAKPKTPKPRFVHEDLQPEVLAMLHQHSLAHPLIPGYCAPTASAIRYWAVEQMYKFCVEHDVPHLWAYLWENWFRKGRWELWARSAHDTIPRLRTTMICESHWRLIKHDYLPHFHSPRVDLLAHVIISKLSPKYEDKLAEVYESSFRRMWRRLENRDESDLVHDKYRPDVGRWVCTCPAYVVNRFLICKHLVQRVQRVPTMFFREVQRNRTAPFWKHPRLVPRAETDGGDESEDEDPWDDPSGSGRILDEDDEEDGDEDLQREAERMAARREAEQEREWAEGTVSFGDEMQTLISKFKRFTAGLEHQVQFRDHRFLQTVRRQGGGLLRMMDACMEKEDRANNNRGRPALPGRPEPPVLPPPCRLKLNPDCLEPMLTSLLASHSLPLSMALFSPEIPSHIKLS